jgi:hypothetical protein
MALSWIQPNLTNTFSNLYQHCSFIEFRHHLYISHVSPGHGLSGPKYIVSEIIKTFVCVTVTSPFLFVNILSI